MVGLVLDLLRAGRLPAIAFSFERKVCHMLAEAVVGYLEVGAAPCCTVPWRAVLGWAGLGCAVSCRDVTVGATRPLLLKLKVYHRLGPRTCAQHHAALPLVFVAAFAPTPLLFLAGRLPACPQKCEAQEKVANYEHYRALRDSAEKAEKAGKAARDAKPDKRQGGEQAAEEPAGGGWDEDAVLPEFSLAGW